ALEAGALARLVERHLPQRLQALHGRLRVVVVEHDRRALGGGGQLVPEIEQGAVIGRLEQLRAERHRRRPRHHQRLRVAGVAGALRLAPVTHELRKKSSNSRSFIRYFSTLPFFTLNSGGWAMKRCPASMTAFMWRKKKVSRSVRMWAPSTSASVIRMILW